MNLFTDQSRAPAARVCPPRRTPVQGQAGLVAVTGVRGARSVALHAMTSVCWGDRIQPALATEPGHGDKCGPARPRNSGTLEEASPGAH
jgi:hypothetical protein